MLALKSVTAGYGRKLVLEDLSLSVEQGEVIAVLGRNGAGKTTMLRAAVGIIPLAAGAVHLRGENITRLPTHERSRRGIAYVPQGRDIFPSLTVEENLLVAAYGSKRSSGRVRLEELYADFPMLAEKRRERGNSLSGGQQQVLALARALMTEPDVLLLDEPSEGIQPSIVDQIGEIVARIHQDLSMTVIVVEQNLDFAASVAPRAYLLDKGRVVRHLSSKELLDDKDIQREYLGL